ncbi:MAG: zf-TFIIB domain-containing protein [Gemmatimonadales bacterium]
MLERGLGAVRYPCPVCLGVQMTKLKPEATLELELDHCERCGGIWFDQGEADLLRRSTPQAVATTVKISNKAWVMQCHACHASMSRNVGKCPACGWKNVLLCPLCQKPLAPVLRDGLQLDVCRSCHGAWFDNVELAEIWNRSVTAVARRRGRGAPPERVVDDYFFLDAFFWLPPFPISSGSPAIVPDLGDGVIDAAPAGGIGDVAGDIVDGTGEVAGGVFEWVADFFDGFDFDLF